MKEEWVRNFRPQRFASPESSREPKSGSPGQPRRTMAAGLALLVRAFRARVCGSQGMVRVLLVSSESCCCYLSSPLSSYLSYVDIIVLSNIAIVLSHAFSSQLLLLSSVTLAILLVFLLPPPIVIIRPIPCLMLVFLLLFLMLLFSAFVFVISSWLFLLVLLSLLFFFLLY